MRTPGSLLYRILFLVPMMLSLLLGITSCRTNTGNNSSTANNPLTILSIVGGNVLVQRSGSSDWSNGKQGITLEAGDKIKTDIGATATITFFDGSVIELNSSTEISLDELLVKSSTSPKTIKIGQTIGETLSRTVKLVDPASEYQITTPSAVAAVRGTTMQVAVAANGSTSVANVEGSVSVTAQGKEIIIPPGQHSLVESGQAPSPPQPGLISTLGVGGTIWTWGFNRNGQLGNGTTDNSLKPVLVGSISGVIAVSGGSYHGLALKVDGTVWDWGTNDSGQLGNGTTAKSLAPIQVSGLAGIISISAGYFHNLALKSDGTVWVWGDNSHGQLGNGTTTNSNMPIQLSGLTGVIAVSGGYYHSLALKSDGSVWAWGMNDHGQLGDGTTTERHVPVQISGLTGVTSISAGDWHSLALKADGTVWAWGSNGDGQLGNGTTVESHAPVPVSSLTGISVISAGGRNNLALGSNGIVWGWGLNDNGELGNGTTVGSHVPVQANVPSGIVAISIRDQHSLALRSDGSIWSWGWNGYGQVGDGTTSNSNLPIRLTGVNGVVAISAGVYYSLAINATPTNTSFNNPWVGVWVGTVTSTLGYYSGPLIATITSTGGNGLAFSYTTPSGLTGSYALVFTSNTMAASTNGAVVFTLNGNTITSVEADSGQTWTAARQ